MLNVFILYIMVISFFVYKSDRIYLNISKDSHFMYFDNSTKIYKANKTAKYI